MNRAAPVLFLLAIASTAPAQSEVWLANGAVMKGNVIEDDGEKVKVELIAEGGSGATALYRYDQLAPRTLYRLRFNKTPRDDVKGQIELAGYALDNGLFPNARLSYDIAKKENEKKKAGMDAELASLYDRAPASVLTFARKEIAAGKHLEAHRYLTRLVELFPDKEEAAEAASLLEEIAPKANAGRHAWVDQKAGKESKPAKEAAAPAIKEYEKAHETVRKAMAEYKKPVQVTRLLKTAIEQFKEAQRLLDRAMKKEGEGTDLAAHYDAWTAKVKEDIVHTWIDIANTYFSRQSNKDAMDAVAEALAVDPESSEALETRARIQLAMADSGKWKW
jgi:tetratricopeptide (TPR) repeat protein